MVSIFVLIDLKYDLDCSPSVDASISLSEGLFLPLRPCIIPEKNN